MNVLLKLFTVPIVSYGATLLTVAILSSILGKREVMELLGGNSAMPVWLAWCAVFTVGVIVQWMYKKWQKRD